MDATLGHLSDCHEDRNARRVPGVGPDLHASCPSLRKASGRHQSSLAYVQFLADGAIHASHFPGEYTEAVLTGVGAFALSPRAIASTPLGRRIDALAETVSLLILPFALRCR